VPVASLVSSGGSRREDGSAHTQSVSAPGTESVQCKMIVWTQRLGETGTHAGTLPGEGLGMATGNQTDRPDQVSILVGLARLCKCELLRLCVCLCLCAVV